MRTDDSMGKIIKTGMEDYKDTIKKILIGHMENLYGGTREEPHYSEENEEHIINTWNTAIKKCVEIVENL